MIDARKISGIRNTSPKRQGCALKSEVHACMQTRESSSQDRYHKINNAIHYFISFNFMGGRSAPTLLGHPTRKRLKNTALIAHALPGTRTRKRLFIWRLVFRHLHSTPRGLDYKPPHFYAHGYRQLCTS